MRASLDEKIVYEIDKHVSEKKNNHKTINRSQQKKGTSTPGKSQLIYYKIECYS